MSNLILAGATLVAGEGQGQLSQCYGAADTGTTTVVAATLANLSTVYTIPAGEANYAGVAYELTCGGTGTWGSTQQTLQFAMFLDTSFGGGSSGKIAAAAFAISAAFAWNARMTVVCIDGISTWQGTMAVTVQETASSVNPGTAATNSVPVCSASGPHTAAIASAVTASIQAQWGSTTGAPTITNSMTTFRKIA
jgi:hypothetical protein